MTYTLTFDQKPTYLHAVITGINTRENVQGYMQQIVVECAVRGCSRVLIEERLEGPRLKALDVFDIASQDDRPEVGPLKVIAYVDVHAEGHLMQFAEDVAVNRGIPVRMFRAVDAAEKWLLEGDPESSP
jgi:hypothetical protein